MTDFGNILHAILIIGIIIDQLPHWVQSEAEASYYHTHKLISTASCDAQTVQTDALFTGKLETRFKNHPKNKTAAGILVSRLKEDGGLPTKVPLPCHTLSQPVVHLLCTLAGQPHLHHLLTVLKAGMGS